jgi:putative N6-adenine-specific DNA methylase
MGMRLFVASAPGVEEMLAAEVRALGGEPAVVAGGVELDGDLALLYRLALGVGVGLRLLVRLGEFKATRFSQLVRGVAELDWSPWLRPGEPVSCKASVSKSRLFHTAAIAQRVRGGIRVRLGVEPAIAEGDDEGVAVLVRGHADHFTVSVDVVGGLLCRRGYRLETGKAPLREDLARALLLASGWDRRTPLADPLCGSGTIAIEAALLATGVAPGGQRAFAFERAPCFDAGLLAQARARFPAPGPGPLILASDRDTGVIAAARANATRAGVDIRIEEASMSAAPVFTEPPGDTGMIVTNPPYGKRVGGRDLRPLYQRLGERVRGLPPGWGCAMVVADRRLATATGLAMSSRLMTDHGGGKIYLMTTE